MSETPKQQRAAKRAAFADHVYDASEPVQLCKWWQTPSCQAAYERAAVKRAERIQKLTADLAQRNKEHDQACGGYWTKRFNARQHARRISGMTTFDADDLIIPNHEP